MREVPPDMEFENEFDDELFGEPEHPRLKPKREEYQWEKTAAQLPPDLKYTFTCCGTLYRFAYAADRDLAANAHAALSPERHARG